MPTKHRLFLVLACLVAVDRADAQMSVPTTGVLPASPLHRSVILGDDLASFQSQWAAPVNAMQQSWVSQINAFADQSVGGVPATFSAAAHSSAVAESAALRFAMTGSLSDLNKAAAGLLNMTIPANNENDFITHPEVLTSYLLAYDFMRGASLTDLNQSTRNSIEASLLAQAQALSNGNGTLSNARGKIGATRALAGELLGDQALLNTGLSDLNSHFGYSTTNDGWFTDAPSSYLNYTLRHEAAFLRAYEQGSGVDLYPNLKPYVDMTVDLRLPDGTVPNVSNGLDVPVGIHLFSQSTDAASAGLAMWNLQTAPAALWDTTNLQNNDYSDASFFALTNFNVAPQAPTFSPTVLAAGDSKITVFRQDWGPTSDYLLMSPGIDSPGIYYPPFVIPAFHSHNDTGEILVAAKGQYILVASGYERTDLSNSPPYLATQEAKEHNVILVNGAMGYYHQGRMERPENFDYTNRLDSTEFGGFKGVSDFATLEYSYGGADVRRSSAFPHEDYFVVADVMNSSTVNSYSFNLIGRGVQTVLTNSSGLMEVKWEYAGAQVIEHLISTHGMSLTIDSTWMHDNFNQFEATQRMRADVSADNAGFLSIIETGVAGAPSALVVTNLSTTQYAAASVVNASAGTVDFYASQPGDGLATAGRLSSDAQYAYLRTTAGALEEAMYARGTQLFFDGQKVLETTSQTTLSILFSDLEWKGTVSADELAEGTQLRLFGTPDVLWATLNGQQLTIANGGLFDSVVLTGGGELIVHFSAVPEAGPAGLALAGLAAAWIRRRFRRNGRFVAPLRFPQDCL